VAPLDALLVGPFGLGVRGELIFPATPLIEERVAEGAARVFRRPPGAAGDIQYRAALANPAANAVAAAMPRSPVNWPFPAEFAFVPIIHQSEFRKARATSAAMQAITVASISLR